MAELPNKNRNEEVEAAIKLLKEGNLNLGAQMAKDTGLVQGLSLLNVAESLQILQLKLEDTANTADKRALATIILTGGLIFATLVLAGFTFYQGYEIYAQRTDTQKVSSADLALQFDRRLNEGANPQISVAVETPGTPILRPKGQFTDNQLEEWLGEYDTIGELYSEGLINSRMAYDLFSYDAKLAYQNPEIMSYLKTVRTETHDPTIYDKFDYVAQVFLNDERVGTARQLDQP